MRYKLMIAVAASALVMVMNTGTGLAQRGGGGGGGSGGMMGGGMGGISPMMQTPRGDLDRTRDRLQDRDLTGDRDRDRLRDKTGDKDQDRDRDRLHTTQVVDDQLTSLSLLSNTERSQFRNEMANATTAQERNRIRAEHQNMMQQRAREMGIDAPAGAGAGGGMGAQGRAGYMLMTMLSDQERAQFMNRLQSAQTAQERQQIRNEMHTMARQRAQEMGVDVPDWYGRASGAGSR